MKHAMINVMHRSLPYEQRRESSSTSDLLQIPEPSGEILLDVLARLGVPAMLFQSDGTLEDATPSAQQFLASAPQDVLEAAAGLVLGLTAERRTLGGLSPAGSKELVLRGGLATLRAQAARRGAGGSGFVVVMLPSVSVAGEGLPASWRLTQRETTIAVLIASGAASKAISAKLGISIHTVRRHSERVFAKLGVSSRSQVALMVVTAARRPGGARYDCG